jgi:Ca2+/Na+ antiporter
MGTLAGSTIMLLTVPWTASLFVAACDLNDLGEAIEKTRTKWTLMRTGITVDHDTKINARLMLCSLVGFLVVQVVAFWYVTQGGVGSVDPSIAAERPYAIAGFALCTTLLVAYCIYQILVPKLAKRRLEMIEKARQERNNRLRALYILHHFPEIGDVITVTDPIEKLHSRALEFARHWKEHALAPPPVHAASVNNEIEPLLLAQPMQNVNSGLEEVADDEDEDEEGEPEGENPREHFWKNLGKASLLMIVGTLVVFIFSDPMVDVIGVMGGLWGIPVFYISFILTPFCSNASELVASLAFAAKKKVANTSMTYSQLYGAVIMNNTMGLGIFYALVAFRGLSWTFSAETLAIVLSVLLVGIPAATRTNFPLYWALLNAPVYFIALLFVFLVEHFTVLT